MTPGPSLTGVRLLIAEHAMGLPVLRALSLCTCCRHYPGAATGCIASARFPSHVSLPRLGYRVGPRIVLFEACSAFTRVTACTLAPSPYFVTRFTEGFNCFVTSTVAPVASGWSISPGGTFTHWKAPPFHGARQKRKFTSPDCPPDSGRSAPLASYPPTLPLSESSRANGFDGNLIGSFTASEQHRPADRPGRSPTPWCRVYRTD